MFESTLDLGKDINKHMNKYIHVIFSKRSVFTYIISFPLSYPSPRRKPRKVFEPNLIIGETQVPEDKDSVQEFRAVPSEGPSSPCYALVPLLTRAGLPLGTVPAGSFWWELWGLWYLMLLLQSLGSESSGFLDPCQGRALQPSANTVQICTASESWALLWDITGDAE